jgi:indole-3-glycerol phosphate synthase
VAFLDEILQRKRIELDAAKALRPVEELKRRIADTPPLRAFAEALGKGFGLIAEIKRRSPSGGDMQSENFERAPAVYAKSAAVKAISVLTNGTDFGMGIEDLLRVKGVAPQPILRKDFIFEDYQVYEARAFGADALLLMVNVLEPENLRRLFALARELGLDVLFEAHTREEIELIPAGAKLYGVNSRKFKASTRWKLNSALLNLGLAGKGRDLSVELDTFSLIQHLPKEAIKIAESGVSPAQLADIVSMGYDAVLVGTSLLKAPEGIESMLMQFEQAMAESVERAAGTG